MEPEIDAIEPPRRFGRSRSAYWVACLLFFGLPVLPLAAESFSVLALAVEGHVATAVVTRRQPFTPEISTSRDGTRTIYTSTTAFIISYQFTDDSGMTRTGSANFAVHDPITPKFGDQIAVEYLPGTNGFSQPLGQVGFGVVYVLIAWVTFDFYLFYFASRERTTKGSEAEQMPIIPGATVGKSRLD